ncbi:DUF4367 domain-containing protein [Caproicibacter sp.]|uniref:DUF4367 domain-containing protein n=1 Tax=Caproicibacter sp. TaxID=2814884 RepID=UPI00398A20FE
MVNKAKLNRELFEAMLKEAVNENFEKEVQSLPSEAALADCELSSGTKRRIESMIREARMKSLLRRVRAVTKRVAVLLAIMIPVSLGSLLSVEASRNAIFNQIMNWKSNNVDIHYQGTSSSQSGSESDNILKPQYLPEGFVEVQTIQVGRETVTKYQDKKETTIYLHQCSLAGEGLLSVDTEHTTREEIELQGEKALLFSAKSPGETSYLIWSNQSRSFLLSSVIDPEQLIKIAQSIEK